MKNRFRLYHRTAGGAFYIHDSETGKQESLGTRDRAEATTLLNARNESVRQPQLNLHIAKAYLAGKRKVIVPRTAHWDVFYRIQKVSAKNRIS